MIGYVGPPPQRNLLFIISETQLGGAIEDIRAHVEKEMGKPEQVVTTMDPIEQDIATYDGIGDEVLDFEDGA